jgi:abortive infection bacteriophage resistance protein
MEPKNSIKLFESKQVRSVWDSEQEKWYISIVDVVEILTGSANPRRYWSDLKIKLKKEVSQLYEESPLLVVLVQVIRLCWLRHAACRSWRI